jgi:hypothetical protein
MVYLKCVLTGLTAAVAAAAIWIVVTLVLPIAAPFLLSRMTGTGGAAGAFVTSDSTLAVALVGFVAGFYWKLRRERTSGSTRVRSNGRG